MKTIKQRLAFMQEGIEAQSGFNWNEYQQLCGDALHRIDELELAVYHVMKRTPFKASATGITAEISFDTIKLLQAALPEKP